MRRSHFPDGARIQDGAMTETTNAPDAAGLIAQQLAVRRRLPAPVVRRAIREASGLSTADIAASLGVTRQAIGKWERGERYPRPAHLARYVAVLDELAGRGQVAS